MSAQLVHNTMLPVNLNTNEVKNAAGVEVEFAAYSATGREKIYAKVGENPSQPFRISFKHEEIGSGIKARRRSLVRVNMTKISAVDSLTPITYSFYVVGDLPIGGMVNTTDASDALAALMSLLATTGAGTTVLFNGTGTAAVPLLDGSL